MNDYSKRIKKLEKQYSPTYTSVGEKLSKESKSKINKKYKDTQKHRRTDSVLNDMRSKDTVKEEVHEIVQTNNLKKLCATCNFEEIVSVIILYVWHSRNPDLRMEQTKLWRKYKLSWRKYGLIVSRLLQVTRARRPVRGREVDLLFIDYLDKKG